MTNPTPWTFTLISLAAFRTFRLIGYDTILDHLRDRHLTRRHRIRPEDGYRRDLDIFLHCPWCLGFWVTLAWWGTWLAQPTLTEFVAVPFALSAVVGLIGKNLDP